MPARLRRLDVAAVHGMRMFIARGFRARLLGLAWLTAVPDDCMLLIPGCRSIHTFGMRFRIDVTFLDAEGRELRTVHDVGPRRVLRYGPAAAVVERRAGCAASARDTADAGWESARRAA